MEKVWYYMKADRQKYGPFTDDELVELLRKGIVTADDWIWMPKMEGWLAVGDSVYAVYLPSYGVN